MGSGAVDADRRSECRADYPARVHRAHEREQSQARPAMRRHEQGSQGSELPALEAESLRQARLGVWESEGGGLGPRLLPPAPRTEVVFDGVRILTWPGEVMTPQATTEALVHKAVAWIGARSVSVADVGTGSGAIAVAIALRVPGARIWAIDDSEAAVGLARANVARHGLHERVEVLLGNLLEPVPGTLDLVVANLPYYAHARTGGPPASTCCEQPEHAICAPGDGLRFNRELIEACRTRLEVGGKLVIQLYGRVLSADRRELDELLREVEARASERREPRTAADREGRVA